MTATIVGLLAVTAFMARNREDIPASILFGAYLPCTTLIVIALGLVA